jgi:hypothetical protein
MRTVLRLEEGYYKVDLKPVADSCGHGNEPFGAIKGGEFFE